MNRLIALSMLATLAATPALAAKDPCKGVKVSSDAFGTKREASFGDLKLKKIGDNWAMNLGFNAGGGYGGFTANTSEVLPPGTIVEVMMADDSVLELATSASAGSTIVYIMGVSVSHYELPLTLPADQVGMLTAQPIKAFRVMKGADPWYTGEVNKGDAKKFQETGTCMLGS